jgi:hypothetical protein
MGKRSDLLWLVVLGMVLCFLVFGGLGLISGAFG